MAEKTVKKEDENIAIPKEEVVKIKKQESDNLFEMDSDIATNNQVDNNKKIIIYSTKNVELPKDDDIERRLVWSKDRMTNKYNSNELTFKELSHLISKYPRPFNTGALFVIDKEVLTLYPDLKEKSEIVKDVFVDIKWLEDESYVDNIEKFKSKLALIPTELYGTLVAKIIAERKKNKNFFSNRVLIKSLCNELKIKEDDLEDLDETLKSKSTVKVLKG